jgi:hypothetical protein
VLIDASLRALAVSFLVSIGCGPSATSSDEGETESRRPAGSTGADPEPSPDDAHTCEWVPLCDRFPCTDGDRAREAVEALRAVAEARGFSDVIEVLSASQVGSSNVVLTYALRHPSFEAVATFVSTSPTFVDLDEHADEWSEHWLDPDVAVVDRARIQERIDVCAAAVAPSCEPSASTTYDPCAHNLVSFRIRAGRAETDDVDFLVEFDAVTGSGGFCSHARGC